MKIEWHHWLVMILIVFVGVALVRRNFLGIPAMVDGLVGSVATPLAAAVPTA